MVVTKYNCVWYKNTDCGCVCAISPDRSLCIGCGALVRVLGKSRAAGGSHHRSLLCLLQDLNDGYIIQEEVRRGMSGRLANQSRAKMDLSKGDSKCNGL